MKKAAVNLFYLLILSILIYGCGSSKYVSEDFNFSDINNPKIAILPVYHSEGTQSIDTIFTNFISDSSYQIIDPIELRKMAMNNENLDSVFKKLHDFQTDLEPEIINLDSILTKTEIELLKKSIKNTDYIYSPSRFVLILSGIKVVGKTTFRLFDIHSGKLILKDEITRVVTTMNDVRTGGLLSGLELGPDIDVYHSEKSLYCVQLLANLGNILLKNDFLGRENKN